MLKYKISTLLTLIIMIFTFSLVKADEPKLIGKVIYIDPGHPCEIKPSINRTSCSKL